MASQHQTVVGVSGDSWTIHVGLRRRHLAAIPAVVYENRVTRTLLDAFARWNHVSAPTPHHYEVLLWLEKADTTVFGAQPKRLTFEGLSLGFSLSNDHISTGISGHEVPSQLHIHPFLPRDDVDEAYQEYLYLGSTQRSPTQLHTSVWYHGLNRDAALVVEGVAQQQELCEVLPPYFLSQFCCFTYAQQLAAKVLDVDLTMIGPEHQLGQWISRETFLHQFRSEINFMQQYEYSMDGYSDSLPRPFLLCHGQLHHGILVIPKAFALQWLRCFPIIHQELHRFFPKYDHDFRGPSVLLSGKLQINIVTSSASAARQAPPIAGYFFLKTLSEQTTKLAYCLPPMGTL